MIRLQKPQRAPARPLLWWLLLLLLLCVPAAHAPCPADPEGWHDPRRQPSGPDPLVGPSGEDEETRLHWLGQAMQRLIDQCAGRAALTPYADLRLPCGGRDVPDSALGRLDVSAGNDTAGCMAALRRQPGVQVSFGGQAWPAIWYRYHSRFNTSDRAWIWQQINRSAAAAVAVSNATHSAVRAGTGNVGVDVSYNNMYYMNMVNVALMGEIAGNARAAELGYRLIDDWLQYARTADLHEFGSPTYYWVQINSLYMGYMYAKRPGAKALFQAILDHTWADIAANYFIPSQTLSGPKSRDYDFLYGHGALMVHTYAQGFPGATNGSLVCEYNDTHCERNDAGQNAFALHNQLHADGYRLPASILALASAPTREVHARFVGQRRDRNGNMRRFAERSNFVRNDSYAIGCASQDYITNTHSKYFPGPQDKLLTIQLGALNQSMVRPVPEITIQPDYLDCPYGHIHEKLTDKPSHLAFHPGMVQARNVLLATTAINVQDTLDGFALNLSQPAGGARAQRR